MKKISIRTYRFVSEVVISLTIISVFFACLEDAVRDNPLDPSQGIRGFELTGQVLTFYHPRRALPNATIQIQPGNIITLTDKDGQYHIQNMEPGSYQVTCGTEGYHSDSVLIEFATNQTYDFFLDGLPIFKRMTVRAHHLSRWFPREEFYFLSIETEVDDLDGLGDIDSVTFSIPSINFVEILSPAITAGLFTRNLFDTDLPVTSIHELIGHEFVFKVQDDFGITTITRNQYVTRIIEQTPILITPIELKTISDFPLSFEWQRVAVPYPATLRIEIFQINFGIAIKIDEVGQIPLINKKYIYEKVLDAGDYFWTLHIVDEFGNSSGSKEGTFRIQ